MWHYFIKAKLKRSVNIKRVPTIGVSMSTKLDVRFGLVSSGINVTNVSISCRIDRMQASQATMFVLLFR